MSLDVYSALNSGVFPDIQRAVRDRLAAFDAFAGLSMVLQYEGEIDSRIAAALATLTPGMRQGCALLIATPAAEETGANLPFARLDPFGVTVSAVEDVIVNSGAGGTGRRAMEWAVLALRALKGWTPPGCGAPLRGWGDALSIGPGAGSRVIHNLTLRTRVDLAPLRLPGEYGYVADG
jgi:hypothetical protein